MTTGSSATSSMLYSFLLLKGGPLELSEVTLEYLRHPRGAGRCSKDVGEPCHVLEW